METKPFGNVKNQIGRCGIWCGSCVVGNGTLKEMAKRCEHTIGGYARAPKKLRWKRIHEGTGVDTSVAYMSRMSERGRKR